MPSRPVVVCLTTLTTLPGAGAKVGTRHDHYALLKTTETMVGTGSCLGHAADPGTGDFRADFHRR